MMKLIDRHKVFISYCHKDEQSYKDQLIRMTRYNYEKGIVESIFDDYSVGDGDIDDTNMTDEQIRVEIRDKYIKNATVMILLCGQHTKERKHIDWEIHAAMYHSDANPQMGIIVINMPSIKQSIRAMDDEEKRILAPFAFDWTHFNTREEYEKAYPYMPSRIIDNLVREIPITIVDWNVIKNDPKALMLLIDKAFKRKDTFTYDHSAPLRERNSKVTVN